MSDEIELYRPPESPLLRFATEASQVHNISKALATTSFVPKAFQNKPEEITAAIMAGSEIDLPPMMALRTIHVIEGRPSLEANAMRGLAQSKGVVFEILSKSDTRVQMRAKGPGQDNWTEVDWTIDRAKKMGLTNKSNWQKMPQAMLTARATSELCRLVASNVLMGLPYSREELEDGFSDDAAPPADKPAATRKTRTVQRAPLPEPDLEPPTQRAEIRAEITAAPEPEPELAPEPEPEPDVPDGEKIRPDTRTAIMAGFGEITKSRDERMKMISQVCERFVPSVNTLTEREGRMVLNFLRGGRQATNDTEYYDWPETAPVPS